MFQKWFAKYARAVSDEHERQWLYKKYRTKTVVSIIFYLLCVAVIVMALVLDQYIEQDWALILMMALILAWIGFAIANLSLWLSFKSTYNSILNRPAYAGEMPEVTAYRQIAAQDKKSTFKKLWWAWLIFAVCVVGFLVCIVMETIKNPDGEDFGVWGITATLLLLAGALTLAFSNIFYSIAKKNNGEMPEQKAAGEIETIDGAQGRGTGFNKQSDDSLASYKYLFPDEQLYEKAKAAQARYNKSYFKVLMAIVVVVVAVVVVMMFFENYAGYGIPIALTLALVGCLVFTFTSGARRELNELEKLQKQELDSNPAYAKNLEWYNLYNNFSKFRGKTIVIFYVIGVALGWVLAAIYPATIWSALGIVPVFVGLFVYNVQFKNLRKKAVPIEMEIDSLHAVLFNFSEGEADEGTKVCYGVESQSLECGGAKGEITIYLGDMYVGMGVDKLTNRIVNFYSEHTDLTAVKQAVIPAPQAAAEGKLYLVESVGDMPNGTGRRINFNGGESYDANNKIYMVGIMDASCPVYKIFANVYAQLSPAGALNCVLCTGIE